jgi:hypothetical protein
LLREGRDELKKLFEKVMLLAFMCLAVGGTQLKRQTICSNQTGSRGGFFYSF